MNHRPSHNNCRYLTFSCRRSQNHNESSYLPYIHESLTLTSPASSILAFSITLALRLRASISPNSTPLRNSSGMDFNSSLHSSPKPAAAVFPAIFPASLEKSSNFDGPMTTNEARATMASSAGPSPKKE